MDRRVKTIPLVQFDPGPVRPIHAQGPRSLDSVRMLRVSVTDRCNLRCGYCMPAGGIAFHDREEHLTPREIEVVATEAHRIGVRFFKITGGEPTVRGDLEEIVRRIASLPDVEVSMTTSRTARVAPARFGRRASPASPCRSIRSSPNASRR